MNSSSFFVRVSDDSWNTMLGRLRAAHGVDFQVSWVHHLEGSIPLFELYRPDPIRVGDYECLLVSLPFLGSSLYVSLLNLMNYARIAPVWLLFEMILQRHHLLIDRSVLAGPPFLNHEDQVVAWWYANAQTRFREKNLDSRFQSCLSLSLLHLPLRPEASRVVLVLQ